MLQGFKYFEAKGPCRDLQETRGKKIKEYDSSRTDQKLMRCGLTLWGCLIPACLFANLYDTFHITISHLILSIAYRNLYSSTDIFSAPLD
jgi:hypothetical protein